MDFRNILQHRLTEQGRTRLIAHAERGLSGREERKLIPLPV
jgi:hypothetical protein